MNDLTKDDVELAERYAAALERIEEQSAVVINRVNELSDLFDSDHGELAKHYAGHLERIAQAELN